MLYGSEPRTIRNLCFVFLLDSCQEFFYNAISSSSDSPFLCWHPPISSQRKPYYLV